LMCADASPVDPAVVTCADGRIIKLINATIHRRRL
jgi:hypothetical protein